MGQYHILVNLDNGEYVNPHDLGMGLKQWEQLGFEGDMGHVLYALVSCSNGRGGGDLPVTEASAKILGRWAGMRVAVVGDYSEKGDLKGMPWMDPAIYYAHKLDNMTNISEDVTGYLADVWGIAVVPSSYGGAWKDREEIPEVRRANGLAYRDS